MTTERMFIAIPIVDAQSRLLQHQQQSIQKTIRFQKWIHPDDLHITLKFLGDTSSQTIEPLLQSLARTSSAFMPFQLQLNGLGTFGKPSVPSILWAGVRGDLGTLASLQKEVEASAEQLGFEREERGYNPHITLARRYQGEESFSSESLTMLNRIDSDAASVWTVSSLSLYRTQLGRKPSYEQVAVVSLGQR